MRGAVLRAEGTNSPAIRVFLCSDQTQGVTHLVRGSRLRGNDGACLNHDAIALSLN